MLNYSKIRFDLTDAYSNFSTRELNVYIIVYFFLDSIISEVEDQAAKISVEEQMHLTTVKNLEKDLDFGNFSLSFNISLVCVVEAHENVGQSIG